MESAGMTCIKYLLFCFNLLFVLSGIVIITVGAMIQASTAGFSEFVDSSYFSAPIILIIVGVIVFIVAFFGCCGAVRENHCMVITFSVFIIIIFTLELAAGIAGYACHNNIEEMLDKRLNESMPQYNNNSQIYKSWNSVQHDFKCCGIYGMHDWDVIYQNDSLPYTCCDNTPKDGSCTINSKDVHKDACLPKLKDAIESNAYVIGGVGIGIAVIQLVGVYFACSLGRSIRKQYETV